MHDDSPRIETARLLLRLPELADLDAWAAMMADEQAAKFIGGVQPRAMCWRSLMTMAGSWRLNGYAMFAVVEKSSGQWLGRLGPWRPEGWPGTEVGWGLRRESWGRGYALEGSAAAIDWAFGQLGWDEVVHTIAPENVASWRLAQRLGSSNRGPASLPPPHEGLRVDLWGQTRAQWQANRARVAAAVAAAVARGAP